MNATVKHWIENDYSVDKAHSTFTHTYPLAPKKPVRWNAVTSVDFAKYTKELQIWESNMEVYKADKAKYNELAAEHDVNMKEFILESNSVRTFVPTEKQVEKLWSKAWEYGNGQWNSVDCCVSDLVELFTA